jgi:signal transduction histidine kinase
VLEVDERGGASFTAWDVLRHKPRRRELAPVLELAAAICQAPMAAIHVVTETGVHPLATVGTTAAARPRDQSMYAVPLEQPDQLIVTADVWADPRFTQDPHILKELGSVRFMATCRLMTGAGTMLGTITVLDDKPRTLLPVQAQALSTLADRVVDNFELIIRTRELGRTFAEVEAVKVELEHSNERLASFAGQVSHDLKTPLTTMSLSLALIREQLDAGESGDEAFFLLDRAIKGSARMADLIDDLLDYASLGGSLKTARVDLNEVMAEVAVDLESDLEDVALEVGHLPVVTGDQAQLRALLQNLVGNAAKYRRRDRPPRITVSARRVRLANRVEVADNGPGVSVEHRERIFEPLARLDELSDGVGIGLSTCRRIVGGHGGAIGFDPVSSGGSRFWFELPD